jgi:hypothetical protein
MCQANCECSVCLDADRALLAELGCSLPPAPEAEVVDVVESEPVSIRVGGRGKLTCVAIVPWRDMVELKLEDAWNPEFWAHVHLDVATLERLLDLAKGG